jgi:hypothetical protein
LAKDVMAEVKTLGEAIVKAYDDFVAEHTIAVDKGNKSAATRARGYTNELTRLCKEYRAASTAAGKK